MKYLIILLSTTLIISCGCPGGSCSRNQNYTYPPPRHIDIPVPEVSYDNPIDVSGVAEGAIYR